MSKETTLNMSDIFKTLAYVLCSIAYAVIFVAYWKAPLLNYLAGVPKYLAAIIFFASCLPSFILIGLASSGKIFKKMQKMENPTRWELRLWRGEVPLPIAFLGYNLLGACVVILVGQFLYFRLANAPLDRMLVLTSVFTVAGLGYQVLSTVGTLRSSRKHTGSKIWIFISRYGVIFTTTSLLLGLILTGYGVNIFAKDVGENSPKVGALKAFHQATTS